MKKNSLKSPAFGSDAPEVITVNIPKRHAKEVEIINKLIFYIGYWFTPVTNLDATHGLIPCVNPISILRSVQKISNEDNKNNKIVHFSIKVLVIQKHYQKQKYYLLMWDLLRHLVEVYN